MGAQIKEKVDRCTTMVKCREKDDKKGASRTYRLELSSPLGDIIRPVEEQGGKGMPPPGCGKKPKKIKRDLETCIIGRK